MKRSYTLPYSQSTTQESQFSQEMPVKRTRYYSRSKSSKSYKRAARSSYKAKLYRSPYSQVYPIERRCQFLLDNNPLNGFKDPLTAAFSPFLGLSFSLDGVQPWLGGATIAEVALPNSSELQAVFDKYRLAKVLVEVFYSHNSSPTGDPRLPVLTQALDFDSVDGTSLLNEYAGARLIQFGNNVNSQRFNLYNPTATTVMGSDAPLIAVVSGQKVSPWLDSAASGVNHYGMRFQLSNFGGTQNAVVGTFMFNVKMSFEFKNPR